MTVPLLVREDTASVSRARRRRWIDVLLILAGLGSLLTAWPLLAAPLIAVGLLIPALTWVAVRRSGEHSLHHLVPAELARSHRALCSAADLPGVVDGDEMVRAADDMVVDVAAVLGGRQPRGASQRRLVECRVLVINQMELELRERHAAWTSAMSEVEALDGEAGTSRAPLAGEANEQHDGGCLVQLLVVALAPIFLTWELLVGMVRGLVGLVEGIDLRLRTLARMAVWAVVKAGRLAVAVVRRWGDVRARLVASFREARHRFVAARVRMGRRLRAAHRR